MEISVLVAFGLSGLGIGLALRAIFLAQATSHRRCQSKFADLEAEQAELHQRNERLLKALRKAQARHATDSRVAQQQNGDGLPDPASDPDGWKRAMRLRLAQQANGGPKN